MYQFESNRAVVYSNMINMGQFKNKFVGQSALMDLLLYQIIYAQPLTSQLLKAVLIVIFSKLIYLGNNNW